MRKDWLETELGEVAEVIMGRQLSPSKRLGLRPRPYLRAANIGSWGISLDDVLEMDFTEDEERHFATEVGDILLVEGGNEKSVGCPALVGVDEANLCIQNTVIRCRVRNQTHVIPEFLFQALRHSFWLGQFGQLCAGTTIMHLGQKRAEVFPISLPPVALQRRIVNLMSSIDSYIAALQQQADAARVARSAVLSELLSAGGEDWTDTTLGEAGIINPKSPALAKDAPFVPMDAVQVGRRFVTYFEPRGERSGARASSGDVLFARITPCLENGKVAQIPDGIGMCGGSTEFIVIRGTEQLSADFAYYWATSEQTRTSAARLMTGTTGRQRLSWQDLASLQLNLPPLSEQQRIVGIISSLDDLVLGSESAVTEATNVRSALLSDLLSGNHEIPESYDRLLGAA